MVQAPSDLQVWQADLVLPQTCPISEQLLLEPAEARTQPAWSLLGEVGAAGQDRDL